MNKLPIGTGLVLPAAEQAEGILERFQIFAEKPGNEPIAAALALKPVSKGKIQGINRASITELIAAMYLDMLSSFSKWRVSGGNDEYMHKQLARMIPEWNDAPEELHGRLLSEVINPVDEEIHDWVIWFDPSDADWSVWYVRTIGYDVVVVRGEDYRIIDWERRMALAKDYVEAEKNGDPVPEDAWIPDSDARRFVDLLKDQQFEAGPLGKSAIETYDRERAKSRRKAFGDHRRMFRGEAPNL